VLTAYGQKRNSHGSWGPVKYRATVRSVRFSGLVNSRWGMYKLMRAVVSSQVDSLSLGCCLG